MSRSEEFAVGSDDHNRRWMEQLARAKSDPGKEPKVHDAVDTPARDLTPVNLDQDGNGTVVSGEINVRQPRFNLESDPDVDTVPHQNPPKELDYSFGGGYTPPRETVAPKTQGTKLQPSVGRVVQDSPGIPGRVADIKAAYKGGHIDKDEAAEHLQYASDAAAEMRDADKRAGSGRARETGRTQDLRLGELAKYDPTIRKAFANRLKTSRQRKAKNIPMAAGEREATDAVNERLRDQGKDVLIEHPGFRSDVTYERVAKAISKDVGLIVDQKQLDEEGKPTIRNINAADLADFARYHRHIFGHPETVSGTDESGRSVNYRVDPAAFSMFHVVGKKQSQGKPNQQPLSKIKINPGTEAGVQDVWHAYQGGHITAAEAAEHNPTIEKAMYPKGNPDPFTQDTYSWMVNAIKQHVSGDLTANRRRDITAARVGRARATRAQAREDRTPPGTPGKFKEIKAAYKGGHITAGEAAAHYEDMINGERGKKNPEFYKFGTGTRSNTRVRTEDVENNSIGKAQVGHRILHPINGEGTVVANTGTHVTVDFGDSHPVEKTQPAYRRFKGSEQVTHLGKPAEHDDVIEGVLGGHITPDEAIEHLNVAKGPSSATPAIDGRPRSKDSKIWDEKD